MDLKAPSWDPHEFWKMKILSMHKDHASGKRWLVGAWFYTPSQLEDINLRERSLLLSFPFLFTEFIY